MVDKLVVFEASPTKKLLPQRTNCTFLSLYQPHILNNEESWQVFPDDKSIFYFIPNESYKPKEIISLEDNKNPKCLTPLENSFSTSDVSNSKYHKEEESKRKIG
jgi:hypothetical protein